METSQEAGAALTAVGAVAGWGRIKVGTQGELGCGRSARSKSICLTWIQ